MYFKSKNRHCGGCKVILPGLCGWSDDVSTWGSTRGEVMWLASSSVTGLFCKAVGIRPQWSGRGCALIMTWWSLPTGTDQLVAGHSHRSRGLSGLHVIMDWGQATNHLSLLTCCVHASAMALALAKAVAPPVIVMSVWRVITVIVATSTSTAIDSTGSSATATSKASNPHPASQPATE